jgi:NADPH:quinone reductase-like Zn-dependent oxidoreductase
MRALALTERFGIDDLTWIDRPTPAVPAGHVLLRMLAAAFNSRDLQVVSGARAIPLPLVPLSDGCGEVIAVGEGVDRWRLGDRVMPIFVQGWISGDQPQVESLPTLGGPLDGTAQELAVWRDDNIVAVPASLSAVEAATLPCAGVSAWNALFVATRISPGDLVLIQGTGGVSLFALQFAKLAGARVAVISSSDEKLERARALGADIGMNYLREPLWGATLRERAGPVDCVVEVGGTRTLEQSLICLRNGGHISFVGFLSGTTPQFDLGELSRKSIGIKGIRIGNRDSFTAMCTAIAQHGLKPVIDEILPFSDAKLAFKQFAAGGHFGKLCLSFA